MTYEWPLYFCLFLALWSAVVGGVFSAFSEFIMAGLLRTDPAGGMEAMQQINRTVIKTQFVAGIMSIPVFAIAFGLYAVFVFSGPALVAMILAPAIFVPSVLLMTIFGNVPMNNKLDSLDHTAAGSCAYWQEYGRVWTRLNHFRTLGSIFTAGLYIIAAVTLIASDQV